MKKEQETKRLSELNPGDYFKREDGVIFQYVGEKTEHGERLFGVKIDGIDQTIWVEENSPVTPYEK